MKPYIIEIAFFSLFLIGSTLHGARVVMRRRQLAPGLDSEELVFHESGITAFSDNGLLCDFDSRQTLELVLTRSELWLRDVATAEQRLCNIVLASIRSIRQQGKFIKIDFLGKNGRSDALLLRLRDRQGFLEQLNALVLPGGPLLPVPLRFSHTATEQTGS
jgi:RecB family endonuclease NucS